MRALIPVETDELPFVGAPITDEEGAAMLRACLNLFRLWGLTDAEAAVLLDLPARTFARWKAGEVGRISRDQKSRLSNLMGIHKALRMIFREPARAYSWIRAPNRALGGRSAADVMLSGELTDLMRVRRDPDFGAGRLVIDARSVRVEMIAWHRAVRIIRSVYPSIDLFEDIADPDDWPLLLSAEQKTNPRLMETIGNIDLVPAERRVGGPGASYLMAPFTHISTDRPSRFSDGSFGVLYVGSTFEVALFETMHHHTQFMMATNERPGWTSQFREIVLDVDARLHDIRGVEGKSVLLAPDDYSESQAFGLSLRGFGSDGIVYPSVRLLGSDCAGLFYPDCCSLPTQGRHLDYHWNGSVVDFYREAGSEKGKVYRVVE